MAAKRRGHNEGTIYQRKDGRWAALLNLGYGPDGKRIRQQFLGRTRREVQEKLTCALKEKHDGLLTAGGYAGRERNQTLDQYLRWWLEEVVKPSVRPKTYTSYEQLVRVHIIPALGRVTLQQLGPQHVQSFLNRKRATTLSPRTVQYLHTILRTSLGKALKWGMVPRNVVTLVDRPRVVKREIRPLSTAQVRTFLDGIKGERLEASYLLAIAEGMREGEILGLRWEDADLEAGTLTVRVALQRVDSKLQLVEPKSRSSRRTITLSNVSVAALRARRILQKEEQLFAGRKWKGNRLGLVFTTPIGTPLEPSGLVKQFKRILAAAGLPRQRFHDLRHGNASLLLALGVHPRVVMERLGHSEISLTMNTYSHPASELQREASERMDNLLTG